MISDMKKKPDHLDSLISYSGVRREDVKLSFGCNIEYFEDQCVEEVDSTSALEGYVGEYFYSADDAMYKNGIEAEMRMDSAELKLDNCNDLDTFLYASNFLWPFLSNRE
ncbi:hypothetical protein Hanom_Chr12g01150871 [Helianthus anomalus]